MGERTELGMTSRADEQGGHPGGVVDVVRMTAPAPIAVVEVERVAAPATSAADHAGGEHLGRERAPAAPPRPFGSAVRVAFGLIWLADAYFKWQPSFLNGLLDVMHDGTMGQPSWLMPWFDVSRAVIAVQPSLWAHGIALVETGIALAVLLGFARKLTYAGGAVWSLLIWMTAEGFGRTPRGEIATDIGAAIIYAVAFLAMLAADQCGGTRAYSLDAVIERRVPWWPRIAEIGR